MDAQAKAGSKSLLRELIPTFLVLGVVAAVGAVVRNMDGCLGGKQPANEIYYTAGAMFIYPDGFTLFSPGEAE
jgi:hypothetical protein